MAWDGDLPRSYQDGGSLSSPFFAAGRRSGRTSENGGDGLNVETENRGSVVGSSSGPSPGGDPDDRSSSFGSQGRPAPHPMVQHLTGLAPGEVPIGGVDADGYAKIGILDRLKRNPFVMVGAAVVLFVLVSHPGGGGADGRMGENSTSDSGHGGAIPFSSGGGDVDAKAGQVSAIGTSSSSSSSSGAASFGFYDKGGGSSSAGDTAAAAVAGDSAVSGGDDGEEEEGADDDDHISFDGSDSSASKSPSSTSSSPFGVQIAWLFAYPMSGASYVEHLASALDPTHPLSSVGANHVAKNIERRPIFEDSPHGPFYVSFDDADQAAVGEEKGEEYDPDVARYVLTKTECSGYCYAPCPPSEFVETVQSFDAACRSTSWHEGEKRLEGRYDAKHVSRAVHMIRDPLSNVVSRFRIHRKRTHGKKGKPQYEEGKEGFKQYCADADKATAEMERASRYFPSDLLEIMADVPCRDEFFKYVQWHNLATLEVEFHDLKWRAVYYEEFDGELEGANPAEAVAGLREFLGLPTSSVSGKDGDTGAAGLPLFRGASMYLEYYTEEQRVAIWKFLKAVAFPQVWGHLERYLSNKSNIA